MQKEQDEVSARDLRSKHNVGPCALTTVVYTDEVKV